MGFLNPKPALKDGEQIRWQKPAGYSLERRSAVSGTVYVTSADVIFVPNRLNFTHRNWDPVRFPVADVDTIGIQERTYTPYDGGMRRRVVIRLRNGQVHVFILSRPDEAAAELQRLLGVGAGESGGSIPPSSSAA